jgi:hypothetical protein
MGVRGIACDGLETHRTFLLAGSCNIVAISLWELPKEIASWRLLEG